MSTPPVIRVWYPSFVPEGALIQNYALCELCCNPFLLDGSGSGICDRQICKAVRIMRQQELEAKEAAGHQAWVNLKYRKAKRQLNRLECEN